MAIKNVRRRVDVDADVDVDVDVQATNRKQERFPVRASLSPAALLWSPGSHIRLPAVQNTQKDPHKQVGALTFCLKNRLKQHFVDKNI
jgi:hypothetical protein